MTLRYKLIGLFFLFLIVGGHAQGAGLKISNVEDLRKLPKQTRHQFYNLFNKILIEYEDALAKIGKAPSAKVSELLKRLKIGLPQAKADIIDSCLDSDGRLEPCAGFPECLKKGQSCDDKVERCVAGGGESGVICGHFIGGGHMCAPVASGNRKYTAACMDHCLRNREDCLERTDKWVQGTTSGEVFADYSRFRHFVCNPDNNSRVPDGCAAFARAFELGYHEKDIGAHSDRRDVQVGSPDVSCTAVTSDGEEVFTELEKTRGNCTDEGYCLRWYSCSGATKVKLCGTDANGRCLSARRCLNDNTFSERDESEPKVPRKRKVKTTPNPIPNQRVNQQEERSRF